MTLLEKINEQYEIGYPIFQKLFQLRKEELIKVLKDIFQDNEILLEILGRNPKVIKTLSNDEPEEVSLHFYSSITINYSGIRYTPEHGESILYLDFDKFFDIDAVLATKNNDKAKNKANEIGNMFYQGSIFDYDKQGHLDEIDRAKDRSKKCVQLILSVCSIEDLPFWNDVLFEIDIL